MAARSSVRAVQNVVVVAVVVEVAGGEAVVREPLNLQAIWMPTNWNSVWLISVSPIRMSWSWLHKVSSRGTTMLM
jgi:hypothetical protein